MPHAGNPPLTGKFRVDLGDGSTSGFAAVVFPPFAVNPDPAQPPQLSLRRAATGALDLYKWWNSARRDPRAALRTVTVELLADDGEPRLRWKFLQARPTSLDYGALDANAGFVTETLVLAFDRVEME